MEKKIKNIQTFEQHTNENNSDELIRFYNEYKELCDRDDLGNHELWTEIGQLTLKHNLTKDDVLYVLNNFDCNFDIHNFLKQTWEDWDKYEEDQKNTKLSDRIKAEIKASFENTVLCARSHSPQESYDYAEKMTNHVIKLIEEM